MFKTFGKAMMLISNNNPWIIVAVLVYASLFIVSLIAWRFF